MYTLGITIMTAGAMEIPIGPETTTVVVVPADLPVKGDVPTGATVTVS